MYVTNSSNTINKPLEIAVLGGGSWGTALAMLACHYHSTQLWVRNPIRAVNMSETYQNPYYLPGIKIPNNLNINSSIDIILENLAFNKKECLLIFAVPVIGLSDLCQDLSVLLPRYNLTQISIIWTCKGLEEKTSRLPSEIFHNSFKSFSKLKIGVLSGPSFAREVIQGLPTALTIASKSVQLCQTIIYALHRKNLRIYTSTDVIGVEIGGALKNIIAIACGISDGLGLGENARSALITRGLAEISRFGIALGSKSETFSGLTGLGDLVLTATSKLSRNRTIGFKIGSGCKIDDIFSKNITSEGLRCVQSVLSRANKLHVELPIIKAVYSILFEKIEPMKAVDSLL